MNEIEKKANKCHSALQKTIDNHPEITTEEWLKSFFCFYTAIIRESGVSHDEFKRMLLQMIEVTKNIWEIKNE